MFRSSLLSILLLLSGLSFATGDPKAGQSKSLICGACHGNNGNSQNALWPHLAGQHQAYLYKQMLYFKLGKNRSAPMMSPMVANLSAQDMADLAAYYADLPLPKKADTQQPSALGGRLYRQGDAQKHIPACITCHGPDGRGNAEAGFPVIAHQNSDYTIQQLHAFKRHTRTTDPMKIMRTISAKLSQEEMRAVAEYLATM